MSIKYEIQSIEKTIRLKEKAGEEASFEKELVKSYKAYLKKHGEIPSKPTKSKSDGV